MSDNSKSGKRTEGGVIIPSAGDVESVKSPFDDVTPKIPDEDLPQTPAQLSRQGPNFADVIRASQAAPLGDPSRFRYTDPEIVQRELKELTGGNATAGEQAEFDNIRAKALKRLLDSVRKAAVPDDTIEVKVLEPKDILIRELPEFQMFTPTEQDRMAIAGVPTFDYLDETLEGAEFDEMESPRKVQEFKEDAKEFVLDMLAVAGTRMDKMIAAVHEGDMDKAKLHRADLRSATASMARYMHLSGRKTKKNPSGFDTTEAKRFAVEAVEDLFDYKIDEAVKEMIRHDKLQPEREAFVATMDELRNRPFRKVMEESISFVNEALDNASDGLDKFISAIKAGEGEDALLDLADSMRDVTRAMWAARKLEARHAVPTDQGHIPIRNTVLSSFEELIARKMRMACKELDPDGQALFTATVADALDQITTAEVKTVH